MTTASLTSVRQRRHTSPHAKWLLNEVAALRGELVRVQDRQSALRLRETELKKAIAALEFVAAPLPVPAGLVAPEVVHAHNKYGPRGALTRRILEHLEAAWPLGVDTHSLVDRLAAQLHIQFATMAERNHCRHSVRNRLHHLLKQQKVERLDSICTVGSGTGVWRLARQAPSLGELESLAMAAATEQDSDGV